MTGRGGFRPRWRGWGLSVRTAKGQLDALERRSVVDHAGTRLGQAVGRDGIRGSSDGWSSEQHTLEDGRVEASERRRHQGHVGGSTGAADRLDLVGT